ncbi:MAG: hypothetical protein U1E65_31700 [Myxococcota bacterium]
MRSTILASALFSLVFGATPAFADLNGVKLAIPDAKGPAAYGGPKIMKELKSRLAAAGMVLIEQAELNKAGKEAKLKPANEADLTQLAKRLGAPFVLRLTVSKKGWLYTAAAVLVNTENGETQMDFKSGFYKPGEEGADRGERIAAKVLEKLGTLTAGGIGAIAVAPPSKGDKGDSLNERLDEPTKPAKGGGGSVNERMDEPTKPAKGGGGGVNERLDEPPPPKGGGDVKPNPYADKPAPSTPPITERLDDKPRPSPSPSPVAVASNNPPPPSPSPSPRWQPSGPSPSSSGSNSASVQVRPETDDSEKADTFRATVGAGSGLVHSFGLSQQSSAASSLSYSLSPLSLFAGDAEFIFQKIHLGVGGRVAFSPIRFGVTAGGVAADPFGTLLDFMLGLKGHFALSGSGRHALELVPSAGMRFTLLGVSNHIANVIHGYTEIAPVLGVELRLPVGERFEALAGVEGGIVLSHSESPADLSDGSFSSGFLFGAGLGGRLWLSTGVGIALDARFDTRSMKLSGPSQRQAPVGEDLTNVGVSTTDLRVGLGVAFRI